jgi:formylglycine-generating enzyme required for sulfatase activity
MTTLNGQAAQETWRTLWRVGCSVALSVMAVVIISCGGSGVGNSNSSVTDTVNTTRAFYQIIDLNSGQVKASGSIADLATNPIYRTNKLVVRLVSTGSGTIGTSSSGLGALVDMPARSAVASNFYVSVFEVTQAQWQLLAGNAPWLLLNSNDGSNDIRIGNNYPAIGLSYDVVNTATQTFYASKGVRIRLPNDVEWEFACRSGGSQTWSWGNTADSATVTNAAIVWETAGTTRGARLVGERQPNSLGLYDMHGNVWELTSNLHIRGGSWNDPVTLARAANRADIDPATRHVLVGARLVYVP